MASALILKKCDPITYFDNFLSTENFPDGRPIDKFPEIKIYPGTSWKKQRSVVVEHGNVVVSIIGRLILQRDNDSPTMVFKLESLDKRVENSFNTVKTTLDSFVKSNVFFDRDQLKTDEDAFRYQLRFTITIFTAEGFIMSPILTGLNALLLQIKIPKIEYQWLQTLERDEQTIDPNRIKINENECLKLKLKEIPVYSCFALYCPRGRNNPMLISDPVFDLIPFCSSIIEMTCISNQQILLSNIQGNVIISPEVFEEAGLKALEHHDEVVKSLGNYIKILNLD